MSPADRSAERALLRAALRAFLNQGAPAELRPLSAGALDWEWLLRRAEEERLGPLLYTVCRGLPAPVPILDRLRGPWVAFQRQYLLGVEQLRGILAAFEREGVVVIPLKGPVLGASLYGEPGLRPFTDLDLLVPRAEVPRALHLLSGLGYRHLGDGRPLPYELAYAGAACFVSSTRGSTDFPVDLHWELVDEPGAMRVRAIDPQEVWDRAVKVDRFGHLVLELCAEDLLIYLALHWAVHHAFSGLVWRLDLALLLRRCALDWDAVAERARRWRVRGALYVALSEVQAEFRVGPPPTFLAGLRPRGLRPAVVGWLSRRRGAQLERLDYLVPFLLMDGGRDLLRALASGALPPAGWARFRYGTESLLGAYLVHYGRIGKVFLRTVRAALPRWGKG